jgi:beta-lactamase class D
VESANKDFDIPGVRMKILKEILSDLGFMKGNK